MKYTTLCASIACLVLLSACEQKESDKSSETLQAPAVVETAGMALPATTSSDAARERYMAGWADYEKSRFKSAGDKFLQAAETDPDFAMAHLMAALSSASTEGFVSNLKKASSNSAWATRGEQLLIESFEKAFAADAIGRIEAVKQLTALHPASPHAWVFLGDAYGNVNDSAEARAAYGKAISLDAKLVPAHINLGNSLLNQEPKDFAAAEMHFQHAIAITPNEPNPYDLLGDVHRAQNNLKAAYDDYTKAAELAPELGSALQQRGHVNSFLGNYDEARADYARAAELEDARGSNVGGNFLTYKAFVHAHQGNLAAAIEELRALAADADASYTEGVSDLKQNALTLAALFAIEAGDQETASTVIADAAAVMRQQANDIGSVELKDAQEANIAYLEGLLAARMGDAEAATAKAKDFERFAASSSNPLKLQRMHEILGMAAYYQDDFNGAIEHLSAGDQLNNMYAKYYLAKANAAADNKDEAMRLYKEMASYNFNGPGYAMFRKDILAKAAGS